MIAISSAVYIILGLTCAINDPGTGLVTTYNPADGKAKTINQVCLPTYSLSLSSETKEGESVMRAFPIDQKLAKMDTMGDVCELKDAVAALLVGVNCNVKIIQKRKLMRLELDYEDRP